MADFGDHERTSADYFAASDDSELEHQQNAFQHKDPNSQPYPAMEGDHDTDPFVHNTTHSTHEEDYHSSQVVPNLDQGDNFSHFESQQEHTYHEEHSDLPANFSKEPAKNEQFQMGADDEDIGFNGERQQPQVSGSDGEIVGHYEYHQQHEEVESGSSNPFEVADGLLAHRSSTAADEEDDSTYSSQQMEHDDHQFSTQPPYQADQQHSPMYDEYDSQGQGHVDADSEHAHHPEAISSLAQGADDVRFRGAGDDDVRIRGAGDDDDEEEDSDTENATDDRFEYGKMEEEDVAEEIPADESDAPREPEPVVGIDNQAFDDLEDAGKADRGTFDDGSRDDAQISESHRQEEMEHDIQESKVVPQTENEFEREQEISHQEQEISHQEQEFSHHEQEISHHEQEFSHQEQEFSHQEQEISHQEQEFSHQEQEFVPQEGPPPAQPAAELDSLMMGGGSALIGAGTNSELISEDSKYDAVDNDVLAKEAAEDTEHYDLVMEEIPNSGIVVCDPMMYTDKEADDINQAFHDQEGAHEEESKGEILSYDQNEREPTPEMEPLSQQTQGFPAEVDQYDEQHSEFTEQESQHQEFQEERIDTTQTEPDRYDHMEEENRFEETTQRDQCVEDERREPFEEEVQGNQFQEEIQKDQFPEEQQMNQFEEERQRDHFQEEAQRDQFENSEEQGHYQEQEERDYSYEKPVDDVIDATAVGAQFSQPGFGEDSFRPSEETYEEQQHDMDTFDVDKQGEKAVEESRQFMEEETDFQASSFTKQESEIPSIHEQDFAQYTQKEDEPNIDTPAVALEAEAGHSIHTDSEGLGSPYQEHLENEREEMDQSAPTYDHYAPPPSSIGDLDPVTSSYEEKKSFVDNLDELASPETIPQPLPSPPEPRTISHDFDPLVPDSTSSSPPRSPSLENHYDGQIETEGQAEEALYHNQVTPDDLPVTDGTDFLTAGEVEGETTFGVDGSAVTKSASQNNQFLTSEEEEDYSPQMEYDYAKTDGEIITAATTETTATTETETETSERSGDLDSNSVDPGAFDQFGHDNALMSMSMEGSFYDDGGDLMGGDDNADKDTGNNIMYQSAITEESEPSCSFSPRHESLLRHEQQFAEQLAEREKPREIFEEENDFEVRQNGGSVQDDLYEQQQQQQIPVSQESSSALIPSGFEDTETKENAFVHEEPALQEPSSGSADSKSAFDSLLDAPVVEMGLQTPVESSSTDFDSSVDACSTQNQAPVDNTELESSSVDAHVDNTAAEPVNGFAQSVAEEITRESVEKVESAGASTMSVQEPEVNQKEVADTAPSQPQEPIAIPEAAAAATAITTTTTTVTKTTEEKKKPTKKSGISTSTTAKKTTTTTTATKKSTATKSGDAASKTSAGTTATSSTKTATSSTKSATSSTKTATTRVASARTSTTSTAKKSETPSASRLTSPTKKTADSKTSATTPAEKKTPRPTSSTSSPRPASSTTPKTATSPTKAPAKSMPLPSYAQPITRKPPRETKASTETPPKRPATATGATSSPRPTSMTTPKSRPASATTSTTTRTSTATSSRTTTTTSATPRPKSSPTKLVNGSHTPRSTSPTKKPTSATKPGEKKDVKATPTASSRGTASPAASGARSPQKTASPRTPTSSGAAKSKIGSLNNASHTPGGGAVKITTKKVDYSAVSSRVGSKDKMTHKPGGGNVKIENRKVKVEAVKSKVGSMDNATHRPAGGDKKIETKKLDWKVESKIGSLDNARHVAGGGDKKIENRKLEWSVNSKVGSLDNAKHVPKGGDKKIETRKTEWNVESRVGSLDNASHSPGGGIKKIETVKTEWNAQSKVGSLDNVKHQPGGGDKQIVSEKLDWKVDARIGSLENAKHTPGGGNVQIEDHHLNFKETASAKIGSMETSTHIANGSDAPTEESTANGGSPV